MAFAADVGDIYLSVSGTNLGCGDNLYVSPLSPAVSDVWVGRWRTCGVLGITRHNNYGIFYSVCKSPGHTKEIQLIKLPNNYAELNWQICQINIIMTNASKYKYITYLFR